MRCAIMQPTYLPWSGYFNLISQVDRFVFLDDVQFEKQSWQTRNRILLQGQECLISVPVRKTRRNTLIREVLINNGSGWRRKHWLTLRTAYAGTPFGEEALALLEPVFNGEPPERLSEFNQAIILRIAQALSLSTTFVRASDLQCGEARSKHLIEILRKLECDEYLSPRGSAAYLEEDNFVTLSEISLLFQEFQPAPYKQFRSKDFISHLSIIDVIANIGIEATKTYIS